MEPPTPEIQHLTFLFDDVEGSTRLADPFPAEAGAGLARYHDIVAGSVERHGGRIFERIGDGARATSGSPDARTCWCILPPRVAATRPRPINPRCRGPRP